MGLLIYIISIALSLYVGVLFFRKWNLHEIALSEEELAIKVKELGLRDTWHLSYSDRYKAVPIGLSIWMLFLLIICSFIPVLNTMLIFIFPIVALVVFDDIPFDRKFNTGSSKISKFLNKKI
jgi:hypothetical protein